MLMGMACKHIVWGVTHMARHRTCLSTCSPTYMEALLLCLGFRHSSAHCLQIYTQRLHTCQCSAFTTHNMYTVYIHCTQAHTAAHVHAHTPLVLCMLENNTLQWVTCSPVPLGMVTWPTVCAQAQSPGWQGEGKRSSGLPGWGTHSVAPR